MYQKFSFFFCSSIKEPDQYDYYADTKPVLYNGIGDLYTVSKNNLGAKIQIPNFLKQTEIILLFLPILLKKWSSQEKKARKEIVRDHATSTFILQELPNEAIIVNTIACALVALAILMPCILKCDSFRKGLENEADVESDVEWREEKPVTLTSVLLDFKYKIKKLCTEKKMSFNLRQKLKNSILS